MFFSVRVYSVIHSALFPRFPCAMLSSFFFSARSISLHRSFSIRLRDTFFLSWTKPGVRCMSTEIGKNESKILNHDSHILNHDSHILNHDSQNLNTFTDTKSSAYFDTEAKKEEKNEKIEEEKKNEKNTEKKEENKEENKEEGDGQDGTSSYDAREWFKNAWGKLSWDHSLYYAIWGTVAGAVGSFLYGFYDGETCMELGEVVKYADTRGLIQATRYDPNDFASTVLGNFARNDTYWWFIYVMAKFSKNSAMGVAESSEILIDFITNELAREKPTLNNTRYLGNSSEDPRSKDPESNLANIGLAILAAALENEEASTKILNRNKGIVKSLLEMTRNTSREVSIGAFSSLALLAISKENKNVLFSCNFLRDMQMIYSDASASSPETQAEKAHYIMQIFSNWFHNWEGDASNLNPEQRFLISQSIGQLGETYLHTGLLDAAVLAFSSGINMDSENFMNYFLLGIANTALKNYSQAITNFKDAVSILDNITQTNPALEELADKAKLRLATVMAQHGDMEQKKAGTNSLKEICEEADSFIAPILPTLAIITVESLISLGDLQEASDLGKSYLKQLKYFSATQRAKMEMLIAHSLLTVGRDEEALEVITDSASHAKYNIEIQLELAVARIQSGKVKESDSQAFLNKLSNYAPYYPISQFLLGKIFFAEGDYFAAETCDYCSSCF